MGVYDELAGLYDIAFSWDVAEEVDWLLERFGSVATLLEPACGSGRFLPVFDARGVAVTGLDASEAMLELARRRIEGTSARLVRGDMRDFELDERFDGACCPVNTFGHLVTPEDAARHLEAVARHLRPGARYLVQLDINDPAEFGPAPPDAHGAWDTKTEEGTLRTLVQAVDADEERRVEVMLMRYEWTSGPRAGQVREDRSEIRVWSWAEWSALIEASPFRQVEAWKASSLPREPAPVNASLEGLRLTWHVLEV